MTKDEFIEGVRRMGMSDAETYADQIFKLVDTDGSGAIQFSEFATATMNKNKLLEKDKLKAAFSLLDVDGNGAVSFNEL